MKVLGLTGWSGAGKTTLLTKLIPVLTVRGLTVSTIKHAHHSFDVDKPGKDSHRHRAAGATEVLISSAARWALMHENRDDDEPGLEALLAHMTPVDLVLVEGFKSEGGLRLAGRCAAALSTCLPDTCEVLGMRIPILRATKMPAVLCSLGPPATVVRATDEVASALAGAITAWADDPASLTGT